MAQPHPETNPDPAGAVLEVSDLDVSFPGGVHAVRGVGYHVARGEVLGIVGESGSGKSVTSLAVMGLLPESAKVSGSVKLHGEEILGLGDKELAGIRGKTIGMIFQDPLSALTPVYTVGEQIAEAIRIHRDTSKTDADKRAVELLDLVGIPNPTARVKAFPHEFSGGMRQRTMIAMAIANDPDVIIADEPTTALDVTIQAQVLEVLQTAQQATGAAIIMITHDLGVVAGLADRVLVMYAGRPVELGDVEEVYYRPRMPYTMGLLSSIPRIDRDGRSPLVPIEGNPPSPAALPPGCPFSPRCPLVVDACRDEEPALVRVESTGEHRAACIRTQEIESSGITAEEVFLGTPAPGEHGRHGKHASTREKTQRPGSAVAAGATGPAGTTSAGGNGPGEAVLTVDQLVKHYPLLKGAVFKRRVGTVYAVDGISFDMHSGETLALVGESGCGKSTALSAILELTRPQSGSITVLGNDVSDLDGKRRKALRADLQVVFQDPMAALDPRLPVGDIIAEPLRAHGFSGSATRVRELLQVVGLEAAHAARYPQSFSGGQRQRIGIARALALEPRVLLLDEPVSALDVSIQAGVINLLQELKNRLGLSYLFVAHDLSVVRQIADRIAVMYLGRIAEIGTVDLVYEAPAHPYTQALLSAIPVPDPRKERERRRILLPGDLPSPADPPSGCRFRTRCPKFAALSEKEQRRCVEEEPQVHPVREDHDAACHYAEEIGVV